MLDFKSSTVLGLKVTVAISAAVSIGGVVGLSIAVVQPAIVMEVLMKNPISKFVSVWCGVALLWRPGGLSSPSRGSAPRLRRITSQEQRGEVRFLPSTLPEDIPY